MTSHQMFVYIYYSKTNEISFTTHSLDIAYYVLNFKLSPCSVCCMLSFG